MSSVQKNHTADVLGGIGERIRLLRKKKGMTQAELSGGDITRNMLSRIEHGAALPSLPTLCAIAGRLNIPAGALLGDLDTYLSMDFEKELSTLYKDGKYAAMITAYESDNGIELREDAALLLCRAYICCAKKHYKKGRLADARAALSSAKNMLARCRVGDADDMSEHIYLTQTLIDACPAQYDGDNAVFGEDASVKLREIIYDKNETAVYLYAISKLAAIAHSAYSMPIKESPALRAELLPMCEGLSNELYRKHIEAKLDLINADYLGAKAKLVTTLMPEPAAPILYDILRDLEFCCKCCGDFENAYKYSGMRLELSKHIS